MRLMIYATLHYAIFMPPFADAAIAMSCCRHAASRAVIPLLFIADADDDGCRMRCAAC